MKIEAHGRHGQWAHGGPSHAVPSLRMAFHVVPSSDDASKFNVPMLEPYMWYQNSAYPAPAPTALSSTKGPTFGSFGFEASVHI